MGDLFMSEDVKRLLHNKFVIIFGDSIQRGVYRDLICMLQANYYLTPKNLKGRGELSFMGDKLIEGGSLGERHNGKHYREVRQYQSDHHLVRYYYITRAYSEYLEDCIDELENGPVPDVIIMNSCIWDLTRYGYAGRREYSVKLQELFHRLQHVVPESCLMLWLTAMPLAQKVSGGVFVPGIEFYGLTMRYDVAEANMTAHMIANDKQIDVLDLHYNFVSSQHLRNDDGIHWNYQAHRRMSNLILTHISQAWQVPLPRNWKKLMEMQENSAISVPPMYQEGHNDHEEGDSHRSRAVNREPRSRHTRSESCDASMLAQMKHNGLEAFGRMKHGIRIAQPSTSYSNCQVWGFSHLPQISRIPYIWAAISGFSDPS